MAVERRNAALKHTHTAADITDFTAAVTALEPVGANPTGTIGLSAVNGSAVTFLRSDGAPALSQAIEPTWTAQHIFTESGGGTDAAIRVSAVQPSINWYESDGGTDAKSWDISVNFGVLSLRTINDANSTVSTALSATRSGNALTALAYGNSTDNPTHTFYGVMVASNGIRTTSGNSGSINHATATTVATLPNGGVGNSYLISAHLVPGAGSPTLYSSVAIVAVSGTAAALTQIQAGTSVTITMSGLNVQVAQYSGVTQSDGVEWSIVRLM